jgi:putative ABC transport system permease protein
MIQYYFTQAFRNIHHYFWLSTLISTTLGIGIAACTITFTLIYLMSSDPLPSKSDRVFHVQLDNWKSNAAAILPDFPPEQVTWRDASNIVMAKQAKYQAASGITWGMVTPEDKNVPPFLGIVRATHGEFFPMFNVPFLFGQPWSNFPVNQAEYVTVLSKETNQRIFSGANSVGQTLPMLGTMFTVIGVLDDWHLSPKFYDMAFGPFSEPEDIYIPLQAKADLELPHGGSSNCWESDLGDEYSASLNSECTYLKLWVELDNSESRSQYQDFLKQYVEQQKQLGRFPKPINNVLLNINQWLNHKNAVGADIYVFFSLALLFLFVCLFNAASLISTKLVSKTSEIALRRALGANQQTVFTQCVVETIIFGLLGATLGLILSLLGLEGIKLLYPNFSTFIALDITLVLFTISLSVLSSVVAGLIPTLRACSIAPASVLK